jgi:hypothetical protein
VHVLALGGSDCEAVRDAVLGQPVNSVSSLAYVVAAAVVLLRGGPRGPALALAAVGIGSFLYHGPMPRGAEALHDAAIVALVLITAAAAWHRRALPRPPALALVALAAAGILNLLGRTGAPLCRPDSLAQPHAAWHVLTAVAAAVWLTRWPRRADRTTRPRETCPEPEPSRPPSDQPSTTKRSQHARGPWGSASDPAADQRTSSPPDAG